MAVTVRRAAVSDADAISRLTTQLGYASDVPTVETRIARLLARPEHKLCVAEMDGRVVGWLDLMVSDWIDSDSCVIVAGLVVDKDCRGQGIGRLLMRHAEEWARDNGCPMVRLWSSSSRHAAHEFYQAVGYTHIKTHLSFVKVVDPDTPHDLSKL